MKQWNYRVVIHRYSPINYRKAWNNHPLLYGYQLVPEGIVSVALSLIANKQYSSNPHCFFLSFGCTVKGIWSKCGGLYQKVVTKCKESFLHNFQPTFRNHLSILWNSIFKHRGIVLKSTQILKNGARGKIVCIEKVKQS